MKISSSTLTMILVWALGYTHVLGGPYFLFRVIFWIAILPYVVSALLILLVLFKAKQVINTHKSSHSQSNSNETLHVESTIKE
ncbi:MAG: hypothetical protein NTW62_00455 [Candidatus Nomurabacteria bacterium]|nr:hypothetical protein [Candidatus Nomurabacteria bacterium]